MIQALIRPLIGVSPLPAHTLRRFAALLVVACHLGGCRGDEPLGPGVEVAGMYALTDVAGMVLPTQISSSPASGRRELLADTLTLSVDGTIRRVRLFRRYPGYSLCTASFCPPPIDTRDDDARGTWVSRDRVVTLRYGEDVALMRSGAVLSDGALVVTEPFGDSPGAWRYRRQ